MKRTHFIPFAAAGGVMCLVLVACSTSASPTAPASSTQVVATAQAVGTQAAPTVQAAVPTVRAVSTTVAAQAATGVPTLQAVATQFASISSTATASAPIRITAVQSSTTDSTVAIQNGSSSAVDLSGWRLQVGDANASLPSGLVVQPGATVTLHTGTGTSTSNDVYLGTPAQNLAANVKPGAQVMLESPQGPVSAFTVPGA